MDTSTGQPQPQDHQQQDQEVTKVQQQISQVLKVSNDDPMFNWIDVTDTFVNATKELCLGELLHDDTFGLFEAMSAIEMMDPKMDAGMRCNRQNSKRPYTFQTAVEADHLKLEAILPREQIGIIDATFAALVTWLEGHSLAQTVFTNLYLHQPYTIKDPLIKAFSIAILKLVDVIKEFVTRGNVYEEEDFQPTSYCFKLNPDVTDLRTSGMLRDVEDDIQKVLRNTKPKEGQTLTDDALKEREEFLALFARIKFLRLFCMGLFSALNKHDLNEYQRNLTSAKEFVIKIRSTINLGIRTNGKNENLMGFDRLANQRLLPPTFPRYTEIKSREDSIDYFIGLLDRLLSAMAMSKIGSFQAALDFCDEFSVKSPCVLSRSVVQVLYQPLQASCHSNSSAKIFGNPSGNSFFYDMLREACKSFIAPPVLMFSKNPPFNSKLVKDCIVAFFNQCCRPLALLLQSLGHNKARQRDKIVALLEEFLPVQEEADKLDTMLNALSTQSPETNGRPHMLFFSTWLLYYVLTIMIKYVLSGFELELYSHHEYPYLFWYLYELLYPWLTNCLHRADAYLLEYEQIIESQKMQGKNRKKTKSANKKKAPRPYLRKLTQCQGYATMCAGFFKLLAALKAGKKILLPDLVYENECIRYEHRFAPFAHLLTPPCMPYSQFLEVYDHMVKSSSVPDLFANSGKDFQRARQIFESLLPQQPQSQECSDIGLAELKQLISVNKNNFVVSSILSKDSGRKINFDFSVHSMFPSIRIVN